jgi:hypothetical protein
MPLILGTWEAEVRRIVVQGRPARAKLVRPDSTNSLVWWYKPDMAATVGSTKQENCTLRKPGKKARHSKITREKMARGMAQAVECLPSKHKA